MASFRDRKHAGRILASKISEINSDLNETYIVAIPNGGIPVALPIANAYDMPLYVLIARKIQYPWTTESGYGALTSDGIEVYNQAAVQRANMSEESMKNQKQKAMQQILGREEFFFEHLLPEKIPEKRVILVDDGLASGITMTAAIKSLVKRGADRVIVAVPTAHKQSIDKIENLPTAREIKLRVIAEDVKSGWSFAVASAYENWFDETKEHTKTLLDEYNSQVIKKE